MTEKKDSDSTPKKASKKSATRKSASKKATERKEDEQAPIHYKAMDTDEFVPACGEDVDDPLYTIDPGAVTCPECAEVAPK